MYTGVDGCRAGWVSVTLKNRGFELELFSAFKPLVDHHLKSKIILVDMPIGLVSKPLRYRECDRLARKILSPKRHPSVFSPPVRVVLKSKSYAEACRLSRAEIGVALSLQSYNLMKKIKEVDSLLVKNKELTSLIKEAHPEVAFCALAGRPMNHHKRTPEGQRERRATLKPYLTQLEKIETEAKNKFRRGQVGEDDLLDAVALAVMAKVAKSNLVSLPREVPLDSKGLPMQIVYFDKQLRLKL